MTNYLKNIGAFEATFNSWIVKDVGPKNKAALYAEFKTTDGRIVAQRFNRPLGQFDYGKVATLMCILGKTAMKEQVAKANENQINAIMMALVGKPVVILVSSSVYNGKNMFQVKEVLEINTAELIEQGASHDPFGDPLTDDSFGDPISAALEAFPGAKVDEDTIPF